MARAVANSTAAVWRVGSHRSGVLRALSGSQWVLGSQVLTSAANLATTILLVRAIGLEAFGQFAMCFLLMMLARNFFIGGVLAPTATLAPRLRKGSAKAFRGFLCTATLGFTVVSSLILGMVMILLGIVLQAPWAPSLVLPLMVANGAACMSDLASRYHLVHDRPKRTFGIELSRYAIQLGLLVVLIFSAFPIGPGWTLYALALGSLTGALVGLIGQTQIGWSTRLSRVLLPRYWNFMRWMSAANTVETIQTLAPNIIGLALLGEAALGMLRAVSQFANILNLPTNALQQILPSSGSKVLRQDGLAGLMRFLTTVIGGVLIYFTLAALTLFALSSTVANGLFGTEPPAFLAVLLLFIAANLFISVRVVQSTAFLCQETPRPIFVIQGISAVFAVLLSFLALPFGVVGIAMAVAASSFVGMLLCLWLSAKGGEDG